MLCTITRQFTSQVSWALPIVELFLAGLAYLEYQEIINVNWKKLQQESIDSWALICPGICACISLAISFVTEFNTSAAKAWSSFLTVQQQFLHKQ
jgi:uncharacterized membrane protein (Fun14 family)